MTQDSFDSKYDRWMDKIDKVEDKLCDDIPPDEKLAIYDEAIDMYEDMVANCEDIEADNPELCPNSDDAWQNLYDARDRRNKYIRDEYDAELIDWEARVAEGDVPRKYKNWARPYTVVEVTPTEDKPPATKEEMKARFAELMKDVPKKEASVPDTVEPVPKKAGCLVYFGFLLGGMVSAAAYFIA